MIAPEVVQQARELLADPRYSRRQIAWRLGISRQTVDRIANGSRPDCKPRPVEDDAPREPLAVRRCTTCGAVVEIPCRACRVREMLAAGRVARMPDEKADPLPPGEPLGVDLHGEELRRYLEVRAAALRRGEGEPEGETGHEFEQEIPPWEASEACDESPPPTAEELLRTEMPKPHRCG